MNPYEITRLLQSYHPNMEITIRPFTNSGIKVELILRLDFAGAYGKKWFMEYDTEQLEPAFNVFEQELHRGCMELMNKANEADQIKNRQREDFDAVRYNAAFTIR